ncbi:MAG TPA: carbohydrate kinase family protein, partial [Anaerolineaceae bacterium]|nr:carbohydrate kinase family protein [Anaerolineaceae bacterium]
LNPDLILSGDTLPEFDQVEKLIDDAVLTIGSSSAIFACGAARLGMKVAFIGRVGQDLFGEFMLRALQSYGIDTRGVIVDTSLKTGVSVILKRGADRAILTYPGSVASLRLANIPPTILAQSRHLHLASYFLQTSLMADVPALFELAHSLGLTVSLDTNYDPGGQWDSGVAAALRQADIFFPNQTELLKLARQSNLEQALDWAAQQVRTTVVKLGEGGGLVRQEAETHRAQSVAIDVVDTVGAGDTFDAGFVYGYLSGWTPDRSLRMATITGALSARKVGGVDAQPTLQEALKYF